MSASSRVHTKGDDGPEILWEDSERIFFRERRADVEGNLRDVLIVMPAAEHPTSASLDRLAHEYALKDELDGAWAVRPLALIRERGRTMLVLEDPSSEPLDRSLGAPMELSRFLRLAIAIVAALTQLHRHGLVHKDLKPANILVNRTRAEVRFTGFGIASCLPRERQALEPPETIAGTFPYMAPEQTGRMNRSIDSRSDLYALGVTFYQMLTGALPFTASEPMEWVHCHVARRAVPPNERLKEVPTAVSAIIMKLLAKAAEERYQTAAGLESDLKHCLAAWEGQRRIEYFPLGGNDKPDRLLIPERLYGREHEIETLLVSLDRVVNSGTPELVLVSGYAGIGKSTLVQELYTTLISRGGLFASGKFDQHKRDIPYATLAQAFQSLIRHLLAKSDAHLTPWHDALREALGPLGQLIVDLVPELQLIIGSQPPVPEISPQDAQHRFQLVVRRFIGVFAKPEHPLALFLDDLQWLDIATLDLLEDMLVRSDLRHLLLIGAYRHNEVDAKHPLTRKLEAIRRGSAWVQEISLAPLTCDGVGQLTADALRCEPAHATPLAQLIHEKTGGNPFFLIQFLYELAEEALLTFDHDKALWFWDLGRIRAKGYTENVVDLLVDKLGRLPDEVRRALTQLACLGNTAEVTTLSHVLGTSEQRVHADLGEAARIQLIERVDDSYKFVHDRVREAAYALQPAEDRPDLHLRIGMVLAAYLTPDGTSEKLYVVANQLNRGVTAATSEAERERIIIVNLSSGQRARRATAYNAAIAYLEVARGLLGNESHPRHSATAFAVALQRAECEFLIGHLDVAEAQLLVLSHNCSNLQTSAEVTRLRAQLYTVARKPERSVEVCLEFLRQVGIDWCPHPTRCQVDEDRHRLRNLAEVFSDDQLRALPPMADPNHREAIRVLADLVTPALLTDRNLSDLVVLAAAQLTLEHGICAESCYPLTTIFGVLASSSTDAELGFRLSQFGAALADQQPQLGLSGRALLVFGLHVTPWIRPIRSGEPFIQRGLKMSFAVGDLAFVSYAHRGLVSVRLFCGDPLPEVCKDAERAVAFARASGIDLTTDTATAQRDLALGLMGRDEEKSFEISRPIGSHSLEGALNGFFHYAAQIQLNLLAGRQDVALALAELAEKLTWCVRSYSEFTEYRFYTGLAHAAAYDVSQPECREMHVSGLREQHRKLTIWSARIPANFSARQTLLAAELARIEGRELDAQRLYEEAIRLAREAGFVHVEAIAAERAARLYETRGIQTVALAYLANARDCYVRWGADAKVRQLDEMHPYLREKEPVLGPMRTIGTPVGHLDLVTVLKVSEAISSEIVWEKLIDTLLRMAIEHAGAERGLLILPHNSELRIRAEATTGDDSVTINLRDSPISDIELPESLVLYATRAQEMIILDNASAHGAFTDDEYIRRKHVRSVLCLPLIKQGEAVALLYLENNLAPRAFTPARIAVLKFLASEAATSLNNKRAETEARESERRYRETQMELAHANRVAVMGQLAASIAHEINQPIGAAITYANAALSWLRAQPPNWEEVRQALGFILESGARAGEVIDRIRALVKKTPPQKERVDINEAILEVLVLVRAEVAKNAVSAKTRLAEGLPPVWGDRVQLQQVMLNLFINAIEAMSEMDEGSRELLISTERTNSDAVLVVVRDSGPGFPPESAGRIFESFYTTKPEGLGMGLAISHSIIEAHGGRLWATTSPHHGAEFQFILPP